MEKTILPLWFILHSTILYQYSSPGGLAKLGSPGGLANISINDDYLWFIIPVIIARCIALAVTIVEWSVGPSTWGKVEKHVDKVIFVARLFEIIAFHQMCFMAIDSNGFVSRSTFKWSLIGLESSLVAFILILGVYYGNKEKRGLLA